jgi:oxalate decarboxylase/phosphoglucose isomerase-like protein (cupin superfamily)
MSLTDCRLIPLRKIADQRGNLTSVEAESDIPFAIKRIYYLYDIPGGSSRAGHAHYNLHQLFIAMSGSFDITLRDGTSEQRYHLNRSYNGLYVPPMIWRDIDNFSSGSVCLVLASEHYDEADYMRAYPDFVAAVAKAQG